MTDTKRQPVPRIPPMSAKTRSTAHLTGEFPFTEVPISGPVNKSDNTHKKEKTTMANAASKFKKLIIDNQAVIKRKALVAAGATAGLLITGALVELFNRPSQPLVEVYVVDADEETVEDPSSESLEP